MSLLPSETWRENEFQRGYRSGKEAINTRGYERSLSDWEHHSWGDDYDNGFKRALDDYAQKHLSEQDAGAHRRQDYDDRSDGS